MSGNQVWLDAVEAAKSNAAAVVNSGGEIFYVTDANWEILRQQLVEFRIDKEMWTNYSIWVSAIMGARADGTLQNRPTLEETARQREAEDRKPGQTKYRKDGETTTPKESAVHEAMNKVEAMLRGDKPAAEATVTATVSESWTAIPLDKNVEDMEPAMRKRFKNLDSTNMRTWMAKRAVIAHREKFGLDPVK
jgi:hypothetical protein